MNFSNVIKTVAIIALTIASALPAMNASAAIPCHELPRIEPEPDMAVPMIFIELPVSVEAAFSRSQPADRTDATVLDGEKGGEVRSAADNQFRCLDYDQDVVFVGNSTPGHQVQMFARPGVETGVEEYIQLDSLYIERLGQPIELVDGRYLIDFGVIVDGEQYLTGEFIFTQESEGLYLDASYVKDSMELVNEPIVEEISTRFTREARTLEVSQGDWIVFRNLEEEASADIVVTDANGETVFEGTSMGNMLVGGADRDTYVINDMEPGEYQITVTFDDEDNITYGLTLVVTDDGSTAPEASPAS